MKSIKEFLEQNAAAGMAAYESLPTKPKREEIDEDTEDHNWQQCGKTISSPKRKPQNFSDMVKDKNNE